MRRRASRWLLPAALASLVVRGEAGAAVQVDTFVQESAFDSAQLDSFNLTVGPGNKRLLVVGVAATDATVQVTGVSWNGVPLRRLDQTTQTAPTGSCRHELWELLAPAVGNHVLHVSLSGRTGFGLGAIVYTGVDQKSPTGTPRKLLGSGSPISLDVPADDTRPVLGVACLAGPWTTGPTPETAAALVGPGEQTLWDFTEPGLVGIGSHRLAAGGSAAVRWTVTSVDPYAWLAVGVSITPAELPDAGPPSDAGTDGALDVARETGGGEDSAVRDEGVESSRDPDAMAFDDASAASADLALEDVADEDGAPSVRDVRLHVGCACEAGGAGRPGQGGLAVGVLLLLLLGRRRTGGKAQSRPTSPRRFFRFSIGGPPCRSDTSAPARSSP
jgi:MYXO-CTERM domain-containing protein